VVNNNNMENFKIGTKFNTYYGNGTKIGEATIQRVTKASIFFITDNGYVYRQSHNTVQNEIKSELYIIIKTTTI